MKDESVNPQAGFGFPVQPLGYGPQGFPPPAGAPPVPGIPSQHYTADARPPGRPVF
jgi:hypothetical protein